MSANRVVLLLGSVAAACSAAAAFILGAENQLPGNWATAVTVLVIVLGAIAAICISVNKFLDGNQKWEQQVHERQMLLLRQDAANGGKSTGGVQMARSGITSAELERPDERTRTLEGTEHWHPKYTLNPEPVTDKSPPYVPHEEVQAHFEQLAKEGQS